MSLKAHHVPLHVTLGLPKGVKPKVKLSLGDVALGASSTVFALKQVWTTDAGIKVDKAAPGAGGRMYLVSRNEPVTLAMNSDGKIDGEYRCDEPSQVGEGKDRVYVANDNRELWAYDKAGHKQWKAEWPGSSSGGGYYSYYSSSDPSPPVEDAKGNVWLRDGKTVYRFSHDGGDMQQAKIGGWRSGKPMVQDANGNMYTNNEAQVRIAPDMSTKEVKGDADYIFTVGGKPYSVIDEKLYALDYEHPEPNPPKWDEDEAKARGSKKEILHWNSNKKALQPIVSKDGNIHLLLRDSTSKRALYVVVSPAGVPLRNGHVQHVLYRHEFNGEVDNVNPVLTPRGTLYMVSQKYDHGWNYSLTAMDRNGNIHTMKLGDDEPAALINGTGERVMVALKSGKVVCVEAKGTAEIMKELKEAEAERETLENLGKAPMGKK